MYEKEIKIIQNHLKQQKINNYQVNNSGYDNLIIIVNDNLVFRFPKKADIYETYEEEAKIVNYLKPFISTEIPNIIIGNKKSNYTVHALIKGKDFHSLEETEKNNITANISKDIAKFFSEMHSVKNIFLTPENNKLEDWGCYKYYNHVYNFVKERGKAKILENTIEKFVEISKTLKNSDNVICHDDLHNGNIIVNLEKQKLAGVIDWGDAAFKNYNYDFMHLDDCLFYNVIEEYEKLMKKKVNIEFVEILKKIRVFGKIGKAIFNGTEVEEKFIKKLDKIKS